MTTLTCKKTGCTLAQTGKCILDNDPVTCPDRLALIDVLNETPVPTDEVVAKNEDKEIARFKSSYTLAPDQVQALMNERYCKVVGILGIPGAGKTACLASLYLLLSHQKLAGFQFRNSKTLMAFEEISRGAKWSGTDQPADPILHTAIADGRTPGFLHLRLCHENEKVFDLLLPDLPGEWTSSLIDNNRSERLSFLKSAEHLWIFVNGEELHNVNTRNVTIHRLSLLFERISIFFGAAIPKVTLVVTHKDQISIDQKHLTKIEQSAISFGFSISIQQVASFSANNDVTAGDGIALLVADLVDTGISESDSFLLNKENVKGPHTRQMLYYNQNINAHAK